MGKAVFKMAASALRRAFYLCCSPKIFCKRGFSLQFSVSYYTVHLCSLWRKHGRLNVFSKLFGRISSGELELMSPSSLFAQSRFLSSGNLDNGGPEITCDILLDIVRDKLRDALDQSTLDIHVALIKVLVKHWRGEVGSTSVTKEAEQLSPRDVYKLATIIFDAQKIVGKVAVELSAPLFRISAVAGDTDGLYSYGKLLETGEGVDADPIEASKLFAELAKKGHPYAQFSLARLYHNGIGVKQDFKQALSLYEVSSSNGVAEANTMIGNMYTVGEGVNVDLKKAAEYFKKAAEKGDISALMSLGAFYSRGTGVEQNFEKSFECYKTAADQGYLTAQYNIGVNYFTGRGVTHDMKKAAYFFDVAARRGHTLAQINLGNMYYFGYGVEKDWQKSRELYKEAAKTNKDAELLLKELEDELREQKSDDPY